MKETDRLTAYLYKDTSTRMKKKNKVRIINCLGQHHEDMMRIKGGKNVTGGLGGYQFLRTFPGMNVKRGITQILGKEPVKD